MNFSDFDFLKKNLSNIQRLFLKTPDNYPLFSINLSNFKNLEVISCNVKVFEVFSSQKKLINYIKDKYPQSVVKEILDLENISGEEIFKIWNINWDKSFLNNQTVFFENQKITPKEIKKLQEKLFQFMTENNRHLFIDKTSGRGFKLNYQRVQEDPFLEKSLLDILRHNPVEDEEFNTLERRYRQIATFYLKIPKGKENKDLIDLNAEGGILKNAQTNLELRKILRIVVTALETLKENSKLAKIFVDLCFHIFVTGFGDCQYGGPNEYMPLYEQFIKRIQENPDAFERLKQEILKNQKAGLQEKDFTPSTPIKDPFLLRVGQFLAPVFQEEKFHIIQGLFRYKKIDGSFEDKKLKVIPQEFEKHPHHEKRSAIANRLRLASFFVGIPNQGREIWGNSLNENLKEILGIFFQEWSIQQVTSTLMKINTLSIKNEDTRKKNIVLFFALSQTLLDIAEEDKIEPGNLFNFYKGKEKIPNHDNIEILDPHNIITKYNEEKPILLKLTPLGAALLLTRLGYLEEILKEDIEKYKKQENKEKKQPFINIIQSNQ